MLWISLLVSSRTPCLGLMVASADSPSQPPLTAAEPSGFIESQPTITTAFSTVTRRRQLGAMRMHSATVIRRFWLVAKLRLRLRTIWEHASARRIQALFRGYWSRVVHHDEVLARRNEWIMARYGSIRTIHGGLQQHPVAHRPLLAARSIQLRWRMHKAAERLLLQRRYMAARRIQRFYRARLFCRFMLTVSDRRVLRDRKAFAAIKIQCVVRGFLRRRWFQRNVASLRASAAGRFPTQQRTYRAVDVEKSALSVTNQVQFEHAKTVTKDLVRKIYTTTEPNREICLWSSQRVPRDVETESRTKDRHNGTSTSLSSREHRITLVSQESGPEHSGFVSQAQRLAPSPLGQLLEKQDQQRRAAKPSLVHVSKQKASERVLSKQRRDKAALDNEQGDDDGTTAGQDISAVMRYVLRESRCRGVQPQRKTDSTNQEVDQYEEL